MPTRTGAGGTKKASKRAAVVAAALPVLPEEDDLIGEWRLAEWIDYECDQNGWSRDDCSLAEWREHSLDKEAKRVEAERLGAAEAVPSPERLAAARRHASAAPPSPPSPTFSALDAAGAQVEEAIYACLLFGKFKGVTVYELHTTGYEWYLKYIVKELIHEKPHAENLVPGLRHLGYLKPSGASVAARAPRGGPPRWGEALLAHSVAEARAILLEMKNAPLARAPALLDRALAVLAADDVSA